MHAFVIALFVDKEEIGSEGNTAAQVTTFLRMVLRTIDANVDVDTVMINSRVISADVNAAVTPNYCEVFELKNIDSLPKLKEVKEFGAEEQGSEMPLHRVLTDGTTDEQESHEEP